MMIRAPLMNLFKKIVEFFEKKKKFSFVILFLILSIISYVSSIPGSSMGTRLPWMSVAYHFSIFAIFAFFLLIILYKKKLVKKQIFVVLLISLLVAVLDEFHQYFVPLRSAGIEDILIDFSGSIIATILYFIIKRSK